MLQGFYMFLSGTLVVLHGPSGDDAACKVSAERLWEEAAAGMCLQASLGCEAGEQGMRARRMCKMRARM